MSTMETVPHDAAPLDHDAIAASQAAVPSRPLQLTAEERAAVERAREDFAAGRTYSISEARALTAQYLAKLRQA
jgi:hypothetical protein